VCGNLDLPKRGEGVDEKKKVHPSEVSNGGKKKTAAAALEIGLKGEMEEAATEWEPSAFRLSREER